MNHRRKRRRRAPKCALCTKGRLGNAAKSDSSTKWKVSLQAARRGADVLPGDCTIV